MSVTHCYLYRLFG